MIYIFRELGGGACKCFFSSYWPSFELGNPVPRRQDGGIDGVYQQDQVGSWQDSLDTLQATKHRVKMLKGDSGAEI